MSPRPSLEKRPHRDLLLWGATGYTGRLTAEHLARRVPAGLRWALGGRDRVRLERLRAELRSDAEVVVADALDRDAIDSIVRTTRVIASTVGPYALYGTPLVEACAEHGVDYCDLSGELQWIRESIDRLHARAAATGARIVHCCGFDSIPSDLGVLLLDDHLRRAHGRRLRAARLCVVSIRGAFSGGTAASMLNFLEDAAREPRVRRLLSDSHSLDPGAERPRPDGPDLRPVRWDEELGRWTGPFLMAPINARIVRRSNALLGWPYGRDFRYHETAVVGGPVRGSLLVLGLATFAAAGKTRIGRSLIRRCVPAPGDGPAPAKREAGSFEIAILGRSDGDPALRARCDVSGDRDPGYAETARMLGESALCLAVDDPPAGGGILTPAACMGLRLVERLRAVGLRFAVRAGASPVSGAASSA